MAGPYYAFATLVTSDHYLPGALAVAAALREVHPSPPTDPEVPFQTVCIVTPETVDIKTVKHLRRAFDVVIGVEVIEEQTAAGLQLLGRPDLYTVLTKLHVFRLTQYDKIIFLDADILPLRPLSHLFTLSHEFSAVPDVGWPDIFNSGMMVLTPGEDKFNVIKSLVKSKGTWDGGDQGVLNEWRGNNWNRLSFTYNTTPTSAYGYAPAYERFGSQISALHFIGPNKPWNEIPYRAPSSASQAAQAQQQIPTPTLPSSSSSIVSAAEPRSYAYSSLVDRWFDVYDRNYRQQNLVSEQKFEEKRYESAWNEPGSSRYIPEIRSANALGLEDLRKLAVEGGSSVTQQKGEGEYLSLPLEGRIDLMRPKREPLPEVKVEGEPLAMQRQAENLRLALPESQPTWQGQAQLSTLPTPGPNEIPPSPQIAPIALPSSNPSTPRASVLNPLPEGQGLSLSQQQQPSVRPSAPPQPGSDTSSSQAVPSSTSYQASPAAPSQTGPSQPLPPANEEPKQQHQHTVPPPPPPAPMKAPRPRSPPLLSWNPAIEPPPNVPPTPSAFPSDAYFPNAWDIPSSSAKLRTTLTGFPPPPTSATFFEAPLPSQIPHHLIQEGHYTNVIGWSQPSAQHAHSQPDISKVSTVFPWEEKPRHMPGRIFPGGETAPHVKYIENMPPEPEPAPEVKTEAKMETPRMKIQMPSTPMGFPGARGYTNAWDSVPSIQKYASRLAKPPLGSAPPPTPRSPHVRKQSDSYRSRGEQSDANSMDGDVEDEGDDDSGIEADSRPSSNERPDRGKARADLPRSGPMSPPSGPSRPKKGYRSYGVQTVPKDVRSVSVQVSQSTSTPTGKSRRNSRHSSASSSPVIMPHIDLPRQPPIQEMVLGAEQTALATPSLGNVHPHTRSSGGRHHHQHGSGVLSPRLHDVYTFESPNRTPPTGSPGTQSPVTRKAPAAVQPTRPLMLDTQQMQAPPFGIVRSSSTETADSPLGPVSPADSLPGPPPRKPVGRTWNPATGVDVFKRGSEEVLARFLRMGSWEEESQSASPSHRF